MDYGGSVVYLCLPFHCFGSENALKLFTQTNNVYFIHHGKNSNRLLGVCLRKTNTQLQMFADIRASRAMKECRVDICHGEIAIYVLN